MNETVSTDLYNLLPAVYRLRDIERGYPLGALLRVLAREAGVLKENIDGLWDDFFVETCDDWVIPYIGDLVGNVPLHEAVRGRRADVAKTIYYRRRKGTLPMLEELARDVTGWGAHAVAFFELLGWTQNLNHLRMTPAPNPRRRFPNAVDRVGTVNLRSIDAVDRIDGPFDLTAHTVDVRPIGQTEGWHTIKKLGIFLWRLEAFRLGGVAPRRSTTHPYGYHLSPLGNPAPLFTFPRPETSETGLAEERHVPGPIRPTAFYLRPRDYYGAAAPRGLRGGDIGAFAGPSAAAPEVGVTIGDEGPHDVPLAAPIADAAAARAALEAAIRGAHPTPPFAGARVLLDGGRLVVLAGVPGADVRFSITDADTTTAGELGLVGAAARPLSPPPGDALSLHIVKDGVPVPVEAVLCRDLSAWVRPPPAVEERRALLGGALPAEPFALTATAPSLEFTIGGDGPRTATFIGSPVTREGARALLETAIRSAPGGGPGFTAARVLLLGDALLVVAGVTGADVAVAAGADATTAGELGLAGGQAVAGLLTEDLEEFPVVPAAQPAVGVTIGGDGPHVARLAARPADLADLARRLETAIRAARATAAFADARVVATGERLFVLPGGAGGAVRFEPVPDDPSSYALFGLGHRVGVDVRLGRIAFTEGDEPARDLSVTYTDAFAAPIGGGPYDRRRPPPRDGGAARPDPDPLADPAAPEVSDRVIRVPSGPITTLAAAVTEWNAAVAPRAVIQIEDNRTYAETITLDAAHAGRGLVIQAKNGHRPTLVGDVVLTGNASGARLELNGLAIEGVVRVEGARGEIALSHCTLVPGRSLDEDGRPRQPHEPSVTVAPPNATLSLTIDRSITGALRLPAEMESLTVRDSVIDAVRTDGRARVVPALVSETLPSPLGLTAAAPALRVTIGEEGPYTARLGSVPADLAGARAALEQAIRAAPPNPSKSPSFSHARVIVVEDRLVVLSGDRGPVVIGALDGDPTAGQLRLDTPGALAVAALVGGPLPSFPALTAGTPRLSVTLGEAGHMVTLTPAPATLDDTAVRLRDAIRAAAPADAAFAGALVGRLDDSLVVLPGSAGVGAVVTETAADPTTAGQLALESGRPALAGSPAGDRPGPATTLERVTVFGAVHARELTLASEVIFTGPAVAERRQAGCVRFSFLPEGSHTPRRFRCQPDSALEVEPDAARQAAIRARLRPAFTSAHYGHPGYAQLALTCAAEIRTGAEDGAEMGAFALLKQPQREANLRARLDEYLPFGLEPGLIYVT